MTRTLRFLAALFVLGWLASASFAPVAHAAATTAQNTFASPEEAVAALVAAAKANDAAQLHAILGPGSERVLSSGDPVADADALATFVAHYDEANALEKLSDTQVILTTGPDAWPMPIPVVKDDAGWRFDTKAGEGEILARRIGRNELATIQSLLAFVDAQREYYERNPEKGKLRHYARRFLSTQGKRDGLYYETQDGEDPSPLGALFAAARAEGYGKGKGDKPAPFHGYYFKMLDGQGPHANGGAYDYLVRGEMFGGFAAVAYPAEWGVSSVMTFLVNQDGVVYQKDLGPKTASLAAALTRFDPDDSWSAVEPDETDATAERKP